MSGHGTPPRGAGWRLHTMPAVARVMMSTCASDSAVRCRRHTRGRPTARQAHLPIEAALISPRPVFAVRRAPSVCSCCFSLSFSRRSPGKQTAERTRPSWTLAAGGQEQRAQRRASAARTAAAGQLTLNSRQHQSEPSGAMLPILIAILLAVLSPSRGLASRQARPQHRLRAPSSGRSLLGFLARGACTAQRPWSAARSGSVLHGQAHTCT